MVVLVMCGGGRSSSSLWFPFRLIVEKTLVKQKERVKPYRRLGLFRVHCGTVVVVVGRRWSRWCTPSPKKKTISKLINKKRNIHLGSKRRFIRRLDPLIPLRGALSSFLGGDGSSGVGHTYILVLVLACGGHSSS
jgi:hypothetical protein